MTARENSRQRSRRTAPKQDHALTSRIASNFCDKSQEYSDQRGRDRSLPSTRARCRPGPALSSPVRIDILSLFIGLVKPIVTYVRLCLAQATLDNDCAII